jgi:hypothetical protein
MNSWIDLSAVGQILVIGLLAGAGLPALFALGLRALSFGEVEQPSADALYPSSGTGSTTTSVRTAQPTTRHPLGLVVAGICFLVVVAAIAYGIDIIVNG